jgi:hypothetical protein
MNRPTDKEIENIMNEAIANNGKFDGMTYEEGVEAALRWVLGEMEESPME